MDDSFESVHCIFNSKRIREYGMGLEIADFGLISSISLSSEIALCE